MQTSANHEMGPAITRSVTGCDRWRTKEAAGAGPTASHANAVDWGLHAARGRAAPVVPKGSSRRSALGRQCDIALLQHGCGLRVHIAMLLCAGGYILVALRKGRGAGGGAQCRCSECDLDLGHVATPRSWKQCFGFVFRRSLIENIVPRRCTRHVDRSGEAPITCAGMIVNDL